MKRDSDTFNVKISNVPLVNLRNEFQAHYVLLQQPEFRAKFVCNVMPIRTPYMIWLGMPEGLLTLLLQRAISGLEAWVAGATLLEVGRRGPVSSEMVEAARNPGVLPGRGMAEKYYVTLPAFVRDSGSLNRANPRLWERTRSFYREVRNPVMHGGQFASESVGTVTGCFDHLQELYQWAVA